MTSTIDQSVIDRLTKLLGMLGSAHDGERAVAAAKADELVRSRGLTWSDVVARPQLASAPRRSSSEAWHEPETIRADQDRRSASLSWTPQRLGSVVPTRLEEIPPPLTQTSGVRLAHLPEGEGGGMNPKHLIITEHRTWTPH